jgi:hypothetical protein
MWRGEPFTYHPIRLIMNLQPNAYPVQKVGNSVQLPNGSIQTINEFICRLAILGFDAAFSQKALSLLNEGGTWSLTLNREQQNFLSIA